MPMARAGMFTLPSVPEWATVNGNMFFISSGIGFGIVLYYLAVGMGLWNFEPLNESQMWNFILAMGIIVLSVVMFIIKQKGMGFVFLSVFILYLANNAQESVLSFFMDPVIFIFIIMIINRSPEIFGFTFEERQQTFTLHIRRRFDSGSIEKGLCKIQVLHHLRVNNARFDCFGPFHQQRCFE